jgi:hypothetical protein
MRKYVLTLSVFVFLMTLVIVSCQKNDKGSDNTNYDTEATVQSDDQSNFSGQIDQLSTDASVILESNGSFAGRLTDVLAGVCNANFTLDSSGGTRTITIVYNGNNCLGTHSRIGTVTVSMPGATRWKNVGAAVTVTYTNLVIKRLIDNKSITINGSQTITNVSGGLIINYPATTSVTHSITSAGMSIKFDDNTTRTWQIARQHVITYNNGLVVTVTGTHTEGTVTRVAEWGTNRLGRAFTSAITEPLIFRQDCGFRLTSGQITHTLPVFSASATFGLNAAGSPTTCPGTGSYYCKVIWTGLNSNTHTVIFPY